MVWLMRLVSGHFIQNIAKQITVLLECHAIGSPEMVSGKQKPSQIVIS
jgi:hypothetical protein